MVFYSTFFGASAMEAESRSLLFSTRFLRTKIVALFVAIFSLISLALDVFSVGQFFMGLFLDDAGQKEKTALGRRVAPPGAVAPPYTAPLEPSKNDIAPPIAMPQVKTCGEMAVKPLPVTHILVHFAMKSADDAGARITKVEEQSALRGWLCAGDLVLSVNGEALAAGSGAMLARQFEQSLRDKPNFEIAIEPIEETAGLQPGRQSAKSRICGEDWSKAVTPPRRC